MSDEPETTTDDPRIWRGLDTAPKGKSVQVLVLGHVDWIYAYCDYRGGTWRDANGTPVAVLAWRPGGDN